MKPKPTLKFIDIFAFFAHTDRQILYSVLSLAFHTKQFAGVQASVSVVRISDNFSSNLSVSGNHLQLLLPALTLGK